MLRALRIQYPIRTGYVPLFSCPGPEINACFRFGLCIPSADALDLLVDDCFAYFYTHCLEF